MPDEKTSSYTLDLVVGVRGGMCLGSTNMQPANHLRRISQSLNTTTHHFERELEVALLFEKTCSNLIVVVRGWGWS